MPTLHPRPGVALTSGDERGLAYGLRELADQARSSANPLQALKPNGSHKPFLQKPFLKVRSVARLFTSDVHDKPWFNDREMWPPYFSMLAGNRFNRFNLSFAIGYDFLQNVTDAYFLFTYPFLLDVPGYKVRGPACGAKSLASKIVLSAPVPRSPAVGLTGFQPLQTPPRRMQSSGALQARSSRQPS